MKCAGLEDESENMIKGGTHPADYEGTEMEVMSNCVRACMRMLV
jgi:hypothetical protein